jgi:O-antigen/teichoic acid export membrane protein
MNSIFKKGMSFKSMFINNISIVLIENIVTKALNFIIITIIARTLGPINYGIYSVVYVSVLFLSALLDFGMENTCIRFSSKYDKERNSIFGLYLLVKVLIFLVVFIIMTIIREDVMTLINKPELNLFYWYFILGLFGEYFIFINDTYLQSLKKFSFRAIINISRFSLIAIFILILTRINKLTLINCFLIYTITIFIIVLFAKNYYKFITSLKKLKREVLLEIISYQKWMILLSLVNNVLTRIDFFIVSKHESYVNIGIYNISVQLAAIFLLLPIALNKVLLPTISSLETEELFIYISKILKIMLVLTILALPFIFLVRPIILLILGKRYIPSILICQILLSSTILHFIAVPLEQAMYALGKVKIVTLGNLGQIIINIILGELFIPKYGIIIAAINICITRILYVVYSYINFKILERNSSLNM